MIAALGLGLGLSGWAAPLNQLTPEEQAEGFVLLFNGRDTTGWRVIAGPPWKVEDGALVGPSQASGWIATEEEFDHFILRLEYWIDRGQTHESNSGIFFRAGTRGAPWVNGYECQISLQDPKNPTGSIYNRVPTSLEQMREIAPERHWNQVEIRAVGSRIQITINGQRVQDCDLHVRDKGVIGLQQHHPGVTVKYRNIRLKRLTLKDAEPGWEPLFNGKDLTGWVARGRAKWEVIEGAIVGSGGMGHLYSQRTFRDLELRAMVRVRGNSGLYFRAHPPENNPHGWPVGYEAQIMNHPANFTTGSLYGRARAPRIITRDGAWFALRVRAVGDHIQIWVNGQLMVDTHDARLREGHVALQAHDPGSRVEFRDIYVRPLTGP
jgi:hypothetical protein